MVLDVKSCVPLYTIRVEELMYCFSHCCLCCSVCEAAPNYLCSQNFLRRVVSGFLGATITLFSIKHTQTEVFSVTMSNPLVISYTVDQLSKVCNSSILRLETFDRVQGFRRPA